MFVKGKDVDGYNLLLSISRNTQRTEIIMSYSSSIEIPNYFECFALQTLHVFNVLYASLHTVLYEPLTVFTHLYRHTVIYGPLTVLTHLYRHTVIYGPLTVFTHLYRHTVIY